jgi:hypothetical protein
MNDLLRRYVLEIIRESNLKIDEDEDEKKSKEDSDDVNEFSGVGAIAGFTAPLGWTGKDMESPKVKERKKRKQPTWK